MSGLFVVIFWRLLILIRKSNDDFVSAVAGGILILLFSQFITNIGANIGLMPITGVTLPFVSYGGSSLVVNMLLIGIAESMMEKRLHS
jgi:rod shape determining protein RodA